MIRVNELIEATVSDTNMIWFRTRDFGDVMRRNYHTIARETMAAILKCNVRDIQFRILVEEDECGEEFSRVIDSDGDLTLRPDDGLTTSEASTFVAELQELITRIENAQIHATRQAWCDNFNRTGRTEATDAP